MERPNDLGMTERQPHPRATPASFSGAATAKTERMRSPSVSIMIGERPPARREEESGKAVELDLLELGIRGQSARDRDDEARDREAADHGPLIRRRAAGGVSVQLGPIVEERDEPREIGVARGLREAAQQSEVALAINREARPLLKDSLARPAEDLAAGHGVALHHLGDLREGELEGVAQHEHYPLGRRQPLEEDEERE